MQWNMSPDGWTRNLRCGGAVQDLVQLPDESKVNKDWGEELGGLIKEALRRRVRATRWGVEDAEGDLREQVAEVDQVPVERDNEAQLGGGQEVLEVSGALEATKNRDGSLSRNSLHLDAVQVGDATGQDHVGGEPLGDQDLLQTGDQPDPNLTPEPHQDGGPALDATPVQPDAVATGNQDPAEEEVLPQEQSLNDGSAIQQGGEEAHVSEFSLLVSLLLMLGDESALVKIRGVYIV